MLTLTGLALNLVGVLILFRWGMPFHVPSGGAIHFIAEQADEKEKALERIYTIIGYPGGHPNSPTDGRVKIPHL
jgi:hypothetical protein